MELGSLTETKRGALLAEAKQIHEKKFTKDDLREWYKQVWPESWQWKKDKSRPQPSDVRSSIAQLRAETPAGFEVNAVAVNGSNAAHNRQAVANVVNRMKAQVNGHG